MSATKGTWKRFAFFDKDVVTENIQTVLGSVPTVAVAEGGMLLFGDSEGAIAVTDRNFNITERNPNAFRGAVVGLSYVLDANSHSKQFIIAVGNDSKSAPGAASAQDSIGAAYTIKVFNAADLSRPIQSFPALGPISQPPGVTLTSFAVISDGSQIAIGLSNGTVLLYVGNFLKESALGKQLTPVILLQQAPDRQSPIPPVSGLHFCELPSLKSNERRIRLFVVRDTLAVPVPTKAPEPSFTGIDNPDDAGILVVDTSVTVSTSGFLLNSTRRYPHTLDELGANVGCSSLSRSTKELLIGRNEGVFTYSVEDRGGAAAFEGPKQCICSVGRYVLVSCLDEETNRTQITVYDLRNKYVGMNSTLPSSERVLMVMQDGDTAYVITSKLNLIRFREKDTTEKLAVLLKKFYYPLAITLAAEEQCEVSQIMNLYKLYGDHLYKKNEFDAAMVQYCATIGHLQPSYVVRQYLDNSRIGNLIVYLEKLHEKRFATKDLTTLLLTCYTKTKDETKIAEFVARECSSAVTGSKQANASSNNPSSTAMTATGSSNSDGKAVSTEGGIDVPSSVNVLHTSGFTGHALQLAYHHRLHEQFIQIQLTKPVPDAAIALSYLAALVFESDVSAQQLNDIVISHGRKLLQLSPDSFTALMIKFCLEDYSFIAAYSQAHSQSSSSSSASAASGAATNSKSVSVSFSSNSSSANNNTATATAQPGSIAALAQNGGARVGAAGKASAPISISELLALYAHLPPSTTTGTLVPPSSSSSVSSGTAALSASSSTASPTVIASAYHLKLLLEGVFDGLRAKTRLIHAKITQTLIEIYLQEYLQLKESYDKLAKSKATVNSDNAKDLESALKQLTTRIMSILDGNHVQYDASHVLLLCHSYEFTVGYQFLLEQACEATDLLVRTHIEVQNDSGLFKIMRLQGRKDPELYIQILKYFVDKTIVDNSSSELTKDSKASDKKQSNSSSNTGKDSDEEDEGSNSDNSNSDDDDDDERWDQLSQVLDLIESQSILTPTQVVTILSRNPELPYSLVSKYITKTIADVSESVDELTTQMQNRQRDLDTFIQTSSASKTLESLNILPWNSGGLGGSGVSGSASNKGKKYDEDDDDLAEMQNVEAQEKQSRRKRFVEMQESMKEKALKHEKFYADLEEDADGFSVVASYFNQYWE